jgi:hypothetical protein
MLRVAEEKAMYAVPRATPKPRFEHSGRYFRGRIIDALRELPSGRTMAVEALQTRIANDRMPSSDEVRSWLADLEKAGLVEMRANRARLPH